MKPPRKIALGLAAWFLLAVLFAGRRGFGHFSAPLVALTVWMLTALVLAAWWKSPLARDWVDTLTMRSLVALHLTRFVGFCFLYLCKEGGMPEAFALPAGIGDVVVATTALVLLVVPRLIESPRLLLWWNIFGLCDIVLVVFSALRLGLRDWPSMAPLREMPFSLLPTFLVPLIIASHILIFTRIAKRDLT